MKKSNRALHLGMAMAIFTTFAGIAVAEIGVGGGTFGSFGGGGGGGGGDPGANINGNGPGGGIFGGGTGLGIGGGGRGGRGGRGGGGGRGGRMGGEYSAGNEPMMPLPADRDNVPTWPVDPEFKNDVFTFVRLRFTNDPTINRNFGPGGNGGTSWLNDWPPADLNLSFRLQQMTSLKVNPNPIQLEITDPRLFDYPFAYMLQVGALQFTQPQVDALRHWLLNGGFLMVDDHWGLATQRNWAQQIHRVFPEVAYQPKELALDHPIFHCVFDLKTLPQVPTLQFWNRARLTDPDQTWRTPEDPGPHYRAIYDDHGRIMVIEDANTDTSDGWEREGDDEEYFRRFSEKIAYPFVINIIFYAMTH